MVGELKRYRVSGSFVVDFFDVEIEAENEDEAEAMVKENMTVSELVGNEGPDSIEIDHVEELADVD